MDRQKNKEEFNKKPGKKDLDLSILNDVSKMFSLPLDFRNISSFIYNFLKKKLKFCVYALLLADDENKKLMLMSEESIPPEVKEEIRLAAASVYSQIIKKEIEPAGIFVTAEKIEEAGGEGSPPKFSSENFYTAPLTAADKTLGLIGLVFPAKIDFSADDEYFIKIIASQLALFLENDRIRRAMAGEKNTFEAVLRSMASAVLVVDNEDKVVLINPLTETFFGVKKQNMLGVSINEAVPQEDIKNMFAAMKKQNGVFLSRELDIVNADDGVERAVKANIAAIRGYFGEQRGIVLVLNDITKEKEIDKAKTDFISITSHELRAPLASIKESVSLICEGAAGEVNEKQKKFLLIAKRNIERLANLVNDLLDISKIESGKMEIKRSRNNINDIAQEARAIFKAFAESKNVEITLEKNDNLPQVNADKDRITQVFANLISNAVKFSEPGDKIVIHLGFYEPDKSLIEAVVEDKGMGIDKKDIGKIFQKFYQADSSTTRKSGGTGIGLAISKDIIELHGGKIWVESSPGEGSKFIFTLPIEYSEKTQAGKTILIIDDDPDFCLILKKILELNNYNAITSLTGEEGVENAKKYGPDLIILDIMMPDIDGFEVCGALKREPITSPIPVIILTALGFEEDAKKAFAMGAEGYIIKPFEKESFLFTIKQFLEKK